MGAPMGPWGPMGRAHGPPMGPPKHAKTLFCNICYSFLKSYSSLRHSYGLKHSYCLKCFLEI